jgi:hypothetical protein
MHSLRLLARTVRGLEHVVAAEVAAFGRVERDRQVPPCAGLAATPDRLWWSVRRVPAPGGVVAAVLPEPTLPRGLRVTAALPVRIAGRPAQLVLGEPA